MAALQGTCIWSRHAHKRKWDEIWRLCHCLSHQQHTNCPAVFHLPLQVKRWTLPKRLASAGQASRSVLDCDRIIVPVRAAWDWRGGSTAAASTQRASAPCQVRRYFTQHDAQDLCVTCLPSPPTQVHQQDVHWVVAMIDLQSGKLEYYDPLQARNR